LGAFGIQRKGPAKPVKRGEWDDTQKRENPSLGGNNGPYYRGASMRNQHGVKDNRNTSELGFKDKGSSAVKNRNTKVPERKKTKAINREGKSSEEPRGTLSILGFGGKDNKGK